MIIEQYSDKYGEGLISLVVGSQRDEFELCINVEDQLNSLRNFQKCL